MARKLPFDPIDEAARQWGRRWEAVPQMHAVTSLMRVQQLVLAQLDEILRPHGLTFARYEALVLLVFSREGALPLGKTRAARPSRRRPPTWSRRASRSARCRTTSSARCPTCCGRCAATPATSERRPAVVQGSGSRLA